MGPIAGHIDSRGNKPAWRISLNPRFCHIAAEIFSRRCPVHRKPVVPLFQDSQCFCTFGDQSIQLINLQMQLAAPIGGLIQSQNQFCGFTWSKTCLGRHHLLYFGAYCTRWLCLSLSRSTASVACCTSLNQQQQQAEIKSRLLPDHMTSPSR
ncbi:hypothetical protein D3C75_444040 [compost metagenome]